MAAEWIAPVSTVVIGIAGLAFAHLANKRGREHAEHLARLTLRAADRTRMVEFSTQVVERGRRVQRASTEWTLDPTADKKAEFQRALDDFSLVVAQCRLVAPGEAEEAALTFEDTYRKHIAKRRPRIERGNVDFQLKPLIAALRASLEHDAATT